MPGIVGIFSPDGVSTGGKASFHSMHKSLRHVSLPVLTRFELPNLLLGRADLGPFRSTPKERGDLIAFMWGEFLNPPMERRELLRDSAFDGIPDDVDLLIGLFSAKRHDFARYLRGSFNAFVINKHLKTLTIVNDRFGFRPLYYYRAENELIFASEVKAILRYYRMAKTVNPAGLADFFDFGYLTGNKTFFNGIEMCPPATVISFEQGNVTKTKYWNLVFNDSDNSLKENDYVDQLAQAIKDSVEANTQGDFRFGLPLSGGLDSRTIAACVPKEKYPIRIYTWGMPNSPEVHVAKKVTEKLGLKHFNTHRTPEHLVENFERSVVMTDGMIPGNLPLGNFLFAHAFVSHVDVCLDGMQAICVVAPLGQIDRETFFEKIMAPLSRDVLRTILTDCHYKAFTELGILSKRELEKTNTELDPLNRFHYFDVVEKQRRLDAFGCVVKRNFVEVRSPLFDYPIIDVVQGIPPELRKQRYIYHKAFCRISPELARIKNVGTTVPVCYPQWLQNLGRIRKGVKWRMYKALYEKAGINYNRHNLCDWGIDYEYWYYESTAIRNFVRQILASENVKKCEHLNSKGVEQILDAHFAGKGNYTDIINRMLTYVIWSKNFL